MKQSRPPQRRERLAGIRRSGYLRPQCVQFARKRAIPLAIAASTTIDRERPAATWKFASAAAWRSAVWRSDLAALRLWRSIVSFTTQRAPTGRSARPSDRARSAPAISFDAWLSRNACRVDRWWAEASRSSRWNKAIQLPGSAPGDDFAVRRSVASSIAVQAPQP